MKIKTKDMILTALFTALTAIGAFISIPIGPAPITLQLLFTALSGIILGAKLGALSQLVYLILGLIGVPIFSGGTGGLGSITAPSFGYVIGFVFGAYIIGKISENAKLKFTNLLMASLVGTMVIYIFGVPYLYYILKNVVGMDLTFVGALKIGFLVFIPGDLIKSIITAYLGIRILPTIRREFAK